jgi:hypothetical protein
MTEKEWTNEDLSNYITHFSENQREYVLKQILESELLQQFLGTTEGRLILNSVVDKIRDNTMKIVSLATKDCECPDTIVDLIRAEAIEMNVAYDFMYAIADMATKGEKHKESIKALKKKR